MPSLLLVVFILQLLLHIINTVGVTAVNELVRPRIYKFLQERCQLTCYQLWVLYNKLPTPTSSSAQKAQKLKKEIVQLKRELGNTSPQDNFSKWAKLDRQHNKAMAEFQKIGKLEFRWQGNSSCASWLILRQMAPFARTKRPSPPLYRPSAGSAHKASASSFNSGLQSHLCFGCLPDGSHTMWNGY